MRGHAVAKPAGHGQHGKRVHLAPAAGGLGAKRRAGACAFHAGRPGAFGCAETPGCAGSPTWRYLIVDSCSVRAKRGGELTGPNPADRAKKGTKHHVAVDGDGAGRLRGHGGHPARPAEAELPGLQGHRSGVDAGAAHRARQARSRPNRPYPDVQVLRSPARAPPVGDRITSRPDRSERRFRMPIATSFVRVLR